MINRLKLERMNLRIKQRELAARINVSLKTISAWECERSQPDDDMALLLSKIFEKEPSDLFPGRWGGVHVTRYVNGKKEALK